MKLPNRKDIRNAYAHSLFLRSADPLNATDRMLCDLGIEVQQLRNWIRDEGQRNNTCTHDILGGEVCQGCKCGKKPTDHDMSATPSPYPESQYTPATHPWRGQTFTAWPPGAYQIDGRPYCPAAWILTREGGQNASVFNTLAQCEARVAEVGGALILAGSNTQLSQNAKLPDA